MAADSYKEFKANADIKSTKALIKLRGEFIRLYAMLAQAEADAHNSEDKADVAKVIDSLEKMSKTAHEKFNLTYAPLPELMELQGGRP